MRKYLHEDPWRIVEEKFDAKLHPCSESLFSLGNGKMGQRANFEEGYSGKSLQGSYVAGLYYPDKTRVGWWKNGYPEYFAKVINSTNWIGIDVTIDGERLDLARAKAVGAFSRVLDMRDATLARRCQVTLPSGAQVEIDALRFLSLADDEIGVVRYQLTAVDRDMTLELTPLLDGAVRNKDSNYDEDFWEGISSAADESQACVVTRTKKLGFVLGCAFAARITVNGKECAAKVTPSHRDRYAAQSVSLTLKRGDVVCVEKFVAVLSSLNHAPDSIAAMATSRAAKAKAQGFTALLEAHRAAWSEKWRHMDIRIDGDVAAQQGIRFNIFQLNQTYTGKDERLNIGPKGFTGEKYGGSTYWDTEAYCLPFYLATADSRVAKQLLVYRYRQLDKAIENAGKLGFSRGAALYPMVTMNGEECHNEWEITFEEIHRNGAIAYAIFNYVRYTTDEAYLAEAGLEVLVAIARFWAQRVNWSEDKQRFVMLGVTGPNEYENNINNNWYTNYLACWCLKYAAEAHDIVSKKWPARAKEIGAKIEFSPRELEQWKTICTQMYFPRSEKLDIFLQQEGYLDKEQLMATDLPADERPINQHWSWDRILRSCFIKQADTLQGFYFFEEDFTREQLRKHFDFYEPRTVHESSLSPCVHVVLACSLGKLDKAYELYLRTSRLDLDDYNHEVHEGLHITSMAGTWLGVVQGFGGMRIKEGKLNFAPLLPESWQALHFTVMFRGRTLRVNVSPQTVKVEHLEGDALDLVICGKSLSLTSGGAAEAPRAA